MWQGPAVPVSGVARETWQDCSVLCEATFRLAQRHVLRLKHWAGALLALTFHLRLAFHPARVCCLQQLGSELLETCRPSSQALDWSVSVIHPENHNICRGKRECHPNSLFSFFPSVMGALNQSLTEPLSRWWYCG